MLAGQARGLSRANGSELKSSEAPVALRLTEGIALRNGATEELDFK